MSRVSKWLDQREARMRFRRHALLLAALRHESGGYELQRLTGLRALHLYVGLDELLAIGSIEARWEEPDGTSRPRRRLYRLAAHEQATP